jgi:protoporphyrinogen oxidase
MKKTAVVIGAGVAGLTAAYELLEKTDILPIVFEVSGDIGGLAKTVNHKGNRIDIGGHRFFSKSDRVMQWWLKILPLQRLPAGISPNSRITYHAQNPPPATTENGPDPETTERVMLVRNRLSHILFERKFYNYPIQMDKVTITNLGPWRIIKIGLSYLRVRLFPLRAIHSLEDFFISRFGRELYQTFFKDYTEKVWGVSCRQIKPEWGAQRVKGLSISTALLHAIKSFFPKKSSISQKSVETSLIERFLYPKYGPGQLWEETARRIQERGGQISLHHRVIGIQCQDHRVTGVWVRDETTQGNCFQPCDYLLSSMPLKDFIACLGEGVPTDVQQVAQGLIYRDFVTVGLLLRKTKVENPTKGFHPIGQLLDNWIYIQEKDVKVGRLQIFNNWSPYMVQNPATVWVGLEYFCSQGDDLWRQTDDGFTQLAITELGRMGFVEPEDVLDHTIVRMTHAYPAYFGSYDQLARIREYTDRIENLFLIGRNGLHRYNNQDHSMLSSMTAVENIVNGCRSKDNIWSVNAEEEYLESQS